ncbi:MAG: non-ribosomal peptide synthetase, partial [bacterium]|nr:non-ribosomal peptide synthetase [bacterium]
DQLEEDSVAYNMPAAFYLEGEFNNNAFKKAYSLIVERHESLRTVLIVENGEPRQKIQENPSLSFDVIDLRKTADKEEKVRELVEGEILTSFNLEKDSLLRFTIIKVETGKHLLLFNMHHIISDGWSMGIFTREFLSAYNCFRKGEIPGLEPLRIHYKDYSVWQNSLLESPGMERQRDFWLEKLNGEVPVLDLPSDNLRPLVQTFNGSSIGFNLSKETTSLLNNFCIGNEVSLFMMLQALVKTLLYRYTGQDDIILGSPIAGRVHEDLENQIGFYVNTLIYRDLISSSQTFNELLASVHKTCTEAFENQDYPLDRLVDELDIKRDLSRSPLFDVMLVLQNNETTDIEFDGLSVSPYETENLISKFDMT